MTPPTLPIKSLSICDRSITLGMSYAEASIQLKKGGCFMNDENQSNDRFVHSLTNPRIPFGDLRFDGDKLTVLTRYWDMDVHDDVSFADAILGLLQKTEGEGWTSCKLSTHTQNEPSITGRSASLVCGNKELLIGVIEEKGKKEISISETIR